MFKIAVQTDVLEQHYGLDGAYKVIKESGFDGVDANFFTRLYYDDAIAKKVPAFFRPGMSDAETAANFEPWAKAAKEYGLDNYQAHAPFPSLYPITEKDDGYSDYLLDVLRKSIIGCDVIGCRNLVIHPFYRDYENRMNAREEWELNIKNYSSLIPIAKACGVTILLENIYLTHRGKVYRGLCGDGREACTLIDTLNDIAGGEVFGFCLDVGHTLLVSQDIRTYMNELGGRIKAFHVHDNDGERDLHMQPYSGKLDWDRFIEGLRDIEYGTTLSFETGSALRAVVPELYPAMLRFVAACGRMFSDKANMM